MMVKMVIHYIIMIKYNSRNDPMLVIYCQERRLTKCCFTLRHTFSWTVHRGTVEDTELINGLVFTSRAGGAGGPSKAEKAKVGFIQFCISPPKTDVSFNLCSRLAPLATSCD